MTNLGYTPEEPIAAIATALAPAALGIVRASGKNCVGLVSKIFSRPKALLESNGNSIVYGWIVDGGAKIDEVLVSVFRAPKSFTGEEMCEISCHGGVNVVQAIYNVLLKNGFRQAERGEFTFRAYINGKTDLTRAEAIREIIDSKTNAGRSRAAGRLAGNLFETIDKIKKLVVDTLASIEVGIEYPEDEETIADSYDATDLKKASAELSALASSWNSEKIYQDGARVVLCGRTNAGKSSLFNALLKEDRAIVSDIEGTTRDFIESWIDFDGVPARLFDTAGLRETSDKIEAVGVERTKDLSVEADLILYLVDSSCGIENCLNGEDKNFIKNALENKKPLILVFNKCDKIESKNENEDLMADKLSSSDFPFLKDFIDSENSNSGSENQNSKDEKKNPFVCVKIAAKKGLGLGSLSSAVKNILMKASESDRAQTGLGSERQKEAVVQALECVNHALSLATNYALDAVVQDLEDCLDYLGEVTGEVTPDDVLGSIFSRFCVGK
ncbi:MAG: tRNA uridine-5-carboxymethylaminomethyl(34) synthesis GTPase MnmE [Treponema sp.]|nr:tRNA uridine-5-carboxymethylaminomethyl(34) synthesis GTPase MnmE [Treponema sp.]